MSSLKSILMPAVVLIAAAAYGAPATAAAAIETIVLMRHAEKPDAGYGQLSCQGLNRSLALAPVLRKRFGVATALYAPNPSGQKPDAGVRYDYVRPLATLEPTAIQMSLPVNVQWGYDRIKPLEAALLSPEMKNATVFVAWEHKIIEIIAREILATVGAAKEVVVPSWGGYDFDSLYIIRVTTAESGERSAAFSVEKQGLDEQAKTCPGEVN